MLKKIGFTILTTVIILGSFDSFALTTEKRALKQEIDNLKQHLIINAEHHDSTIRYAVRGTITIGMLVGALHLVSQLAEHLPNKGCLSYCCGMGNKLAILSAGLAAIFTSLNLSQWVNDEIDHVIGNRITYDEAYRLISVANAALELAEEALLEA